MPPKSKFETLDKKLDHVIEVNNRQNIHLERLSVITAQNQEILNEHMRRTALNEGRIAQVENKLVNHLGFLKGAVWILGSIGTAIGAIIALIQYFKH